MNAYLLTFGLAAAASLVLTRWCRDLAVRASWVDSPDATRKLHASPIPAVGGIALLLASSLALAAAPLVSPYVAAAISANLMNVLVIGLLGTAMVLVGLIDDLWGATPAFKITFQALVAFAAWMHGIRIESLGTHWGTSLSLHVISLPVTVLWLVGITNAFNLLDGIDGLAAGAALFATTALLGVAIASHEVTTALVLAAVAGATAAFLRYNFNPASIFLGDSGSLFLGFTLAALSVQSSQKSAAAFAVAVPVVSLGLPILDTSVVMLRRMISAKPVFSADRRHIHHLLVDRGVSVRDAAIWMYAVSGAFGLVSLLVISPYAQAVGPVLVMLGLAVVFGVQQLQIPELRALNGHLVRSLRRQRPLLASAAVLQTMLAEIAAAPGSDGVLEALGRGCANSGLTSATLLLPAKLAPAGITGGWRAQPSADPLLRVLVWGQAAPAPGVVLSVPLLPEATGAVLTLRAPADDRHQAAIINWTNPEIACGIGSHFCRVAPLDLDTAGAQAVAAGTYR